MAKQAELQPKTREITYPKTKTFIFKEGTEPSIIDETCSEWLMKMARENQAPMPGKCFCNHKTGEIVYVFIYMGIAQIPVLELKSKLN